MRWRDPVPVMAWIIGGAVIVVPWLVGLYLTYALWVLGLFGVEPGR